MTTRAAPWGSTPLDDPRPDAGTRILPYHRLGHADPDHRWWKPLVELVIFGACYLLLTVVFVLLWGVVFFSVRGEDAMDDVFLDVASVDILDPPVFFLLFFSVVLMVPATLAARAVMGPRPLGLLLSVAGRARWGFLGRCLVLALAVYAVGHAATVLVELVALGAVTVPRPVEGFWWLLAMIVLVVPLQSTAEELVFRGYLLQTVGRWLRRPVFAVLLPVPLFTFGHFYDVWGLLSVAFMAIVAGYLAWRTGGLEAAVALHVVNNVMATLFGAFGLADPDARESTWLALVFSVALQLVFAALVVRSARRRGVEVTRTLRTPPASGPLPGPAGRPGPDGWAGPGGQHGPDGWAGPAGWPSSAGWVCPGPPACPGHWAGRPAGSAPQRLP